jgi:hypothetical protein
MASALDTKKQENGSAVYFQMFIERGRAATLKEIQRVYPNVNDEWMSTYEKQAIALKNHLGVHKGYYYSRDSGIMPFIEDIAKSKCGVSIKDTWNPMDIVMVKRSLQPKIRQEILDVVTMPDKKSNLEELNLYMREKLSEKSLIGVSLKGIKKNVPNALLEEANMGGRQLNKNSFTFTKGSPRNSMDFGIKSPYLFDTGEFSFGFQVHNPVMGQVRSFRYSQERNTIQMDLTPKGDRSGSKLGKVSTSVIDKFLHKHGLQRPDSPIQNPHIPAPGKWSDQDKTYWIKFFKKIQNKKIGDSNVDFGGLNVYGPGNKHLGSGIELVIENAIKWEQKHPDGPGRLSSKLVSLQWVHIWQEVTRKDIMSGWLKTLYYGAKKEGGVNNGPFLKIY